MIRPILEVPHKVLKKKAKPIEEITEDVLTLIKDMFETMYDAPGVGLAAPQVGVPLRVIVMDPAGKDEPKNPIVMINPEIVGYSNEKSLNNEGCLSVPGEYADIERPDSVVVHYMNEKGELKALEADGLLAIAIQHETDHLDGKLYIDYLSKTKRDMLLRRIEKTRRLEKAETTGKRS